MEFPFILLFVNVFGISMGLKQWSFTRDLVCNLSNGTNCFQKVEGVQNDFECYSNCEHDDSCIGITVSRDGTCYIHRVCDPIPECTDDDDPRHEYYWSRYCKHGQWDSWVRTCKCDFATFGVKCDKYHKNCRDLIDAGFSEGFYWTLLDPFQQRDPIRVLCRVKPPSYSTTPIFKNMGKLNFNRTWDEYVNGFYHDKLNFWSGLNTWSVLSDRGHRSVYLVLLFKSDEHSAIYHWYHDFVLLKKGSNYEYTYGQHDENYNGYVPGPFQFLDCLDRTLNTPFSTWDDDNDQDESENCASKRGSGWWLSGCSSRCNLLGWGLNNWHDTPKSQRLSVRGVDMNLAKSKILRVEIYLI